MLTQIEITTRCNFDCSYCTGRQMAQADMLWSIFLSILERIKPGIVSLQGEGEPTLWHYFYEAAELIKAKGNQVTTITNATRIDVGKMSRLFDRIGVTIDSLDPAEASKLGRHNLPKVLANVMELKDGYKGQLVIHTVNYGQDLEPIRKWCTGNGFLHVVQALQLKQEYVKVYPKGWNKAAAVTKGASKYKCAYLDNTVMEYFNVNGFMRPCCFIKTPMHVDRNVLKDWLDNGVVHQHCTGCRNITSVRV